MWLLSPKKHVSFMPIWEEHISAPLTLVKKGCPFSILDSRINLRASLVEYSRVRMKITKIGFYLLLAPDYDSRIASSVQEKIVVKVRTGAGIVGIEETDTNWWATKT